MRRIRENLVNAGQVMDTEGDELGRVALFFDVENILLSINEGFHVRHVIDALTERGDVMIRKAYADWGRYRRVQRMFLEEGVQMVFLPSYGISDKNRTDTAICVDAMEILFLHDAIDTFVIVSGDSDFGVLARRLRTHGKRVVGISAKASASHILVKQCHEFIFYESLVGQRVQGYSLEDGEKRIKKALEKIVEDYGNRFRASLLKDRMRKQDSTFSERNYGATSFTKFLENYDHVLKIERGGMVVVVDNDGDDDRDRDRGNGRRRPVKLAPDIQAEVESLLKRAVLKACAGQDGVGLTRLKDTLTSLDGSFDETGLGFRSFTSFLKAFPGIVELSRGRNQVVPGPDLHHGKSDTSSEAEVEADAPRDERPRRRSKKAEEPPPYQEVSDVFELEATPVPESPKKGRLTREERRRIRAMSRPSAPKVPPVALEDTEEARMLKRSASAVKAEDQAAGLVVPDKVEAAEAPAAEEKPAAKKPAAKKTTAKKTTAKKATAKKAAAKDDGASEEAAKKKPAAKKAAAKKTTAKKAAAKKTTTKKAAAKDDAEAPAKKPAAKKPAAKKAAAKKPAAKKPAAKKAAAKKPAAKKATAKKTTAKKTAAADKEA